MLAYNYKIIWNSRKRFSGIIIEQALVFIVLMLCMVTIISTIQKYRTPGLLNTKNVMLFGYTTVDDSQDDLDEIYKNVDAIIYHLRNNSNIESISEGLFLAPYLRDNKFNYQDSITIERKKMCVDVKFSDQFGLDVFKPKLIEGQWLLPGKCKNNTYPLLLTRDIVEKMHWHTAIGKKVLFKHMEYTIVGVIDGLKNNIFEPSLPSIIIPLSLYPRNSYREIAAKVKDKTAFTRDFYKEYSKMQESQSVMPYIIDMEETRNSSIMGYLTGFIVQVVPTLFLLVFSFIGTLGIFQLNAQKRIKEYAIRMAVGENCSHLFWYIILESIFITNIALIPGLLLSIFILDYSGTEILGVTSTIILMFLFSILSAWYSAFKMSKVNISKALNYE